MPTTSPRPRYLSRIISTIAMSMAISCASCASFAWAGTPGTWDAANISANYTAQTLANDNTVNPMRGYYRWRNAELIPQSAPARDAYQRYYWSDLETAPGVYNFSKITTDLANAKSQGRKLAFRIRMMQGYNDNAMYIPAYLANNAQCQSGCGFWSNYETGSTPSGKLTFVPDWNDPYLQQRARAMLSALAQIVGNDEAISWIDVGMFGQFGEWYVKPQMYTPQPAGITPATEASKVEFAKMHFDAFPNRQHVMFALYDIKDTLSYGLLQQTITSKPVGLRTDCLSRDQFLYKQWGASAARISAWDLFKNQWKKAPFVAEFCTFDNSTSTDEPNIARQQIAEFHISYIGNGNFGTWANLTAQQQADMLMLGREAGYRYNIDSSNVSVTTAGQLSVTTTVRNLGNAPSYEPWSVLVELVNDATGSTVWNGQLALNLGSIADQGSTQTVQGTWVLPTLAAGNYTVRLAARDSRTPTTTTANRLMLKWVNSSVSSNGSLNIASLIRN